MSENLMTVSEDERDGIEVYSVPGCDQPKARCPICARRVPAFEVAKLSLVESVLRSESFACGHCRSGWQREAIIPAAIEL